MYYPANLLWKVSLIHCIGCQNISLLIHCVGCQNISLLTLGFVEHARGQKVSQIMFTKSVSVGGGMCVCVCVCVCDCVICPRVLTAVCCIVECVEPR